MIATAVLLQWQGNFEEAIKKWRAIARIADGTDNELGARAWSSIGYLLHKGRSNDLEAVIEAYNAAIRLNPGLAETYYNRGTVKDDLGRHDAAIADLDEAIRLNPDYADAHVNRGLAKNRLGRAR